jgi:lysophospholipase L1-like esterase
MARIVGITVALQHTQYVPAGISRPLARFLDPDGGPSGLGLAGEFAYTATFLTEARAMPRNIFKILLVLLAIIVLLGAWPAFKASKESQKGASEDPLVWEEDIAALEKSANGPVGSILFLGSSSIRRWETLAEDMAPLSVINRGFGGAKINDLVHYGHRLVSVPTPGAVVIFAGANDINPGAAKDPQVIFESYLELVQKIRQKHLRAQIYFINITPSPKRWEVWPIAQETNRLIKEYSVMRPYLLSIDTAPALLKDGKPNEELYLDDGLHLNEKGYAAWTEVIHTQLMRDLLGQ